MGEFSKIQHHRPPDMLVSLRHASQDDHLALPASHAQDCPHGLQALLVRRTQGVVQDQRPSFLRDQERTGQSGDQVQLLFGADAQILERHRAPIRRPTGDGEVLVEIYLEIIAEDVTPQPLDPLLKGGDVARPGPIPFSGHGFVEQSCCRRQGPNPTVLPFRAFQCSLGIGGCPSRC